MRTCLGHVTSAGVGIWRDGGGWLAVDSGDRDDDGFGAEVGGLLLSYGGLGAVDCQLVSDQSK